jgi:hypothetical protein
VGQAGDRQLERAAHRLRPRVLARVDGAAEPRSGRDLIRARELRRRPGGLVADQVEADDVRMAVLGVVAGDLLGRLDAEVADRGDDDPRLDAVVGARVVDPLGDRRVVVRVGEAHGGGVVG